MKITLVRTFRAHPTRINAVTTLHDSHIAISASDDRLLHVWHLQHTDDVLRILTGHHGIPRSIVAFPEGAFIVSGDDAGDIILWNTETGEIIRRTRAHERPITALALTHDGKTLLTASLDKTLCWWNSITGERLHCIPPQETPINQVVVTPDDTNILTAERGHTDNGATHIKVWHSQTGAHIRDFADGHHGINMMGFHHLDDDTHDNAHDEDTHDGVTHDLVTGSTEGDVRIWDWRSGHLQHTIETHTGAATMALFPNTRYLVIGTPKPLLELWDLQAGKSVGLLDEPSGHVNSIAVSQRGERIIVGCNDGMMNVYQLMN